VLVDSERLIVDAEVQILAQMGVSIERNEIISHFVGTTGEDFRARMKEVVGPGGYEQWRVAYQNWFEREFYGALEPIDGIEATLCVIGGQRCVASNSARERVMRSLRATGLDRHFGEHVFTADDVDRGKPEPDLFLHAAAAMRVPPARCVVIEDSKFGVRAARAAGMRALAYAGGITSADDLRGDDTTIFTDMSELPRLLRTVAT